MSRPTDHSAVSTDELMLLFATICDRLAVHFGEIICPLHYERGKPWQLAIAVILSAQCTDKRVNLITPALFAKFDSPEEYLRRPIHELEEAIHSAGFFRAKARSIRGFCDHLCVVHNGVIPKTMEEMLRFPGVGRKTANVILQELYGICEGVVTDTHILRLSALWGVSGKTAEAVERRLMEILPREKWRNWAMYTIFLGRSHCTARRRNCHDCPLGDICLASTLSVR